jgi:hypothetical protein
VDISMPRAHPRDSMQRQPEPPRRRGASLRCARVHCRRAQIVSLVRRDRQTLMFSATWPREVLPA